MKFSRHLKIKARFSQVDFASPDISVQCGSSHKAA